MQTENAEILSSSSDNQAAPNIPQEMSAVQPALEAGPEAATKQPEAGTSEATAEEKPEFPDSNMQARFTQRMTELKEMENKLKESESKIKAFEFLANDPKFRQWYDTSYKQPQQPEQFQPPELTDDEFYAATTSREAMQQILDRQIEARLKYLMDHDIKPELQKTQQQLEQRALQEKQKEVELGIQEFAASVDEAGQPLYPDFWALDEQGLIEPELALLAHIPEKVLSTEDKLKRAYQLAKYPQMGKQAVAQAHDLVSAKKRAVGEKGAGQGNVVAKKMSKKEFYDKTAAELGIS